MSPSQPPEGEPAPPDGRLPRARLNELDTSGTTFSAYVHVPFCRTRCGYCDFNTYTASELGQQPGASRDSWASGALAELDLAQRVLGDRAPEVATVFVGGGTPTLLPPESLAAVLTGIEERFGLAPGAEVTTESNPESVTAADLDALVAAGFTRISFGMQSAVPHVLQVLDRQHTPGQVPQVVAEARAAGFGSVSLDLIYGAPGESAADWQRTLDVAQECQPDHVSAYSLIVEPGTRLASRIRRGKLADIDDDVHAERYLQTEESLAAQGFEAYEVSNWARGDGHRCQHNLAYWTGGHWWGVGPGAHSHVGGVRWWNRRHPAAWAARLDAEESPAEGREVLDAETRRVERVLLELRLATGLPLEVLTDSERARVDTHVAAGRADLADGRMRLTLAGRLLADGIVRDLLD